MKRYSERNVLLTTDFNILGRRKITQTKLIYNRSNRQFFILLTAFIDTPCLWQLAGLYVSDTVILDDRLEDIEARVPLICQ